MLGSPAGPGGPPQRGLWPLAPAPAPSATSFSTDGLSKYGVYSLFPGGPTFGSALYSHASTIGRFASGHIQQSSGNAFHAAHKVSDSLFSATGYTFGASTPPPGSPYSPIPVAQLELLTKGYSNNIIIQQSTPADFPLSPKKVQITEKRCDEKCCSVQKTQKSCLCPISPIKKIQEISMSGCSRTNPIEWTGVNVKKEPGTPCQVAEITTSMSPVVKVEVTSPTQKNVSDTTNLGGNVVNGNGAQIPVGIAVARQRVQHELVASPSLPPAGLLATVNAGGGAQIKEIDNASMAAGGTSGAGPGGGAVLQCGDDRTGGLASWQVGGSHGQTLTTPTLWQYPAPVPVEPMVPLPMSTMPPVGFQLVRDPTTGGLLLLPATGIEPVQQTVVWPSYPQPSPVLLPSLSSIPPPPLQLLSSASSDYLSSSTTLHQHTQTHSTRLVAVTTDTKRKIPIPLPATTLIKIETDGSIDQTKTLQAVSTIANNSGMFTDQTVPPLVTTHVIYQHPTTNLIVSQTPVLSTDTTSCRSQATSPAMTTLTPPHESLQIHEEEPQAPSTVQDASNQTDTPICSEDDNTIHTIADVVETTEDKTVDTAKVEATTTVTDDQLQEAEMEQPQVAPKSDLIQGEVEPEDCSKITPQDSNESPDLSGLELLSNSIVEFERNVKQQPEETTVVIGQPPVSPLPLVKEPIKEELPVVTTPLNVVDDSLGGLDLLCALAEQRILEEKNDKPSKKERREKSKERHRDRERRKEKRKSKKHSLDEPKRKKLKHRSSDKEHRKRDKRHSSDKSDSDKEKQCGCQFKHYKTPESEQEVKRFLDSKNRQNFCCKDYPCMNAMELDMRMKLAELQREYREKQKELSQLKPKKHSHECSKKKSRKKSTTSERSVTPVEVLQHQAELETSPLMTIETKQEERIGSAHKRRHSRSSDSSPEKSSSASKKRKVGRPKRLMSDGGELVGTETIVARKLKSSFVGCLLAAKEKLKQQPPSPAATPPRYIEETTYTHKLKKVKNNNNTIILSDDIKSSNIRPKLKAEPTIKTVDDEDMVNDWQNHFSTKNTEEVSDHIEEDIEDSPDEGNTSNENFSDGLLEKEESLSNDNVEEEVEAPAIELKESLPNPCALTEALLEVDKLRVLTAMGGLFYAGQLNAIEPPDVYSITLDGERGNRPHIMSREEILRDAIVEVAPKSTEDLPVGTRLCAYWSQQYRCLYPGSAAEPGTPDPQLDGKFVCVEFDDGDSGRIALNDIRLLPPNYPIIEYDPNPLLSLSKRKRRASTSISMEEKQPPELVRTPVVPTLVPSTSWDKIATEQTTSEMERYKEKRRMKKRKKEKQKDRSEERKKKKKHRCTEEPCSHKKHHKKRKKHRKHHDRSRTSESSEGSPRPGFVCQIIEDEEPEPVVPADDVRTEISTLPAAEEDTTTRSSTDDLASSDDSPANPDDEVTMDDILESTEHKKSKKIRDRQESCESRSKMSAFLPARQLWHWSGKGYKRPRAKGKSKKCFYKAIQRGKETIMVGDAAVFLSTGRPDRPYIGRIEAMWELCGTMAVKVKWFYHPEETVGCPANLQYPGALFESPHVDENDVQTISHKCEVLPFAEYRDRLGDDPARYATIYDNNDIYYLAGYYDPTNQTLKTEPGIPFT